MLNPCRAHCGRKNNFSEATSSERSDDKTLLLARLIRPSLIDLQRKAAELRPVVFSARNGIAFIEDEQSLSELTELTAPFLLSRLSDLAKNLPKCGNI